MDAPASLFDLPGGAWRSTEVAQAIRSLSTADGNLRGAVFTKREVVDFILDLSGYRVGSGLAQKSVLEPAFGAGDFIIPVIERLLVDSLVRDVDRKQAHERLAPCIRAVELHHPTAIATRRKVRELLVAHRLSSKQADVLLDHWLIEDDFLLAHLPDSFDCIVGNPPYVRQELIPEALLAEYRSRYHTLYDRADLYVPFFERSLGLLKPGGVLGFICSDRWMKNKYGGPLRRLIADGYHLSTFVDMVDTAAFQSEVVAYTAITVITRNQRKATKRTLTTNIVRRPEISNAALGRLSAALTSTASTSSVGVTQAVDVANGEEPWLLDMADEVALLRELEKRLPLIEEVGCKIGIGVATGCDRAYIGRYDELPVEPARKLPLVMAGDLIDGVLDWQGMGVVNPFKEDGTLAALDRFPRFGKYIGSHREAIQNRNVAKRSPERWYRTIDRIYPSLTSVPKLLIPDIKGEANVVYDEGRFYPHHNLYYVTSEQWELRALQAVLRSEVARMFVRMHSVQMRGGYLRFQAQYLRRIRLPRWQDVPAALKKRLTAAGISLDQGETDDAVAVLYGLKQPIVRAIVAVG